MVASGAVGIMTGVVSLMGLADPRSGDLMARPMGGLAIATVVGMLALLSLQMAHLASRRASHAEAIRVADRPYAGPCGRTARPLDAPIEPRWVK